MTASREAISLADLPEPPPGKFGWPWTEGSRPLPPVPSETGRWPRISIIIPSFNQAGYLEETIRSILLQGYPDLELFVIDGGSTDGTLEIIRRYEAWIDGWVSEKDKGQSEAINKGFTRCTGEIINWLCSDDFLTSGALQVVAREFGKAGGCDVVAGACFCQFDDEPEKSAARSAKVQGWERIPYSAAIWQPSCYFKRSLVERRLLVQEILHYCMDRELWCYFVKRNARWRWVDDVLSHFRFTAGNKSVVGRDKIINEIGLIYSAHVREWVPLPLLLKKLWLPLVLRGHRGQSFVARHLARFVSRGVSMVLLAFYPRERVRALQEEFYLYSVW